MPLIGIVISLFVAAILGAGTFGVVKSSLAFQQEQALIAQLHSVQDAVSSYANAICGPIGGTNGATTGLNCSPSSMTALQLQNAGYLPDGFGWNQYVTGTPTITQSGQNFMISATLTSAQTCSFVANHLTMASCSGTTVTAYAPIVKNNVWTLINSGQFVYP